MSELAWVTMCNCSDADSSCVELAEEPNTVYVRNSSQPTVVVQFSREEWNVFCAKYLQK